MRSRGRFVVTAALPYANGELHLGHIASTYLPSDIFVRYLRLKGHEVVYICATDDFGTPILVKAEKEGKTPEEYVRYWHRRDAEDFEALGISFDLFHMTSSEECVGFAQYVFKRLYENGYIYKKRIEQFYCEYDKKFLPDRYVIGTCPYCGAKDQYGDGCEVCGRVYKPTDLIDPRCAICGRRPVLKETEHYYFRLSSLASELRDWLEGNEKLQPDVKKYVLRWIEDGLEDWDITRDISWGVPIPLEEASGKVLYGWFDNHLCYISSTLLYLERKGIDGKEFWNSSTIYHFIGKDIVYHHYLLLPAIRIAMGREYKLPDYMPTRGHLLLEGRKFSKSKGWYVSLRDFLNRFDPDYLRFYLASITPSSQNDVNFEWEGFKAKINNELVANIGNFVYRALIFVKREGGVVPEPDGFEELDEALVGDLKNSPKLVGDLIERNELDKALKEIEALSSKCNGYFQHKEPWRKRRGYRTCLYLSINAVRSLAILLFPYIPFSSERIWRMLDLEGDVASQSWDDAGRLGVKPGHRIGEVSIPFEKV